MTGLWYVASGADVFEALRRAAMLGFQYVDLHGMYHAGPAHLTQEARLEVRRTLDRLGLQPRNYALHTRHNIPTANHSEQAEDLEYLSEGIECAVGWGIGQLMLNAGELHPSIARAQAWRRAVAFLQTVCEIAERRGVLIVQEPEPYVSFLVHDLATAREMLHDVNRPNFGMLVDLGHMWLAGESPEELRSIADQILHVHLSDHEPRQHRNQIIGTGGVTTADYLAQLKELDIDRHIRLAGYDELVLSFELGFPGDTIPEADDWVRRSIAAVQAIDPTLVM
jgi:sugar phosphate isomerase/epimerase